MPDTHTLLLILSWLVYFGLHSLLASIGAKQFVATRWPGAMPAYRLVFNVLAVLLLAVPLWLTLNAPQPWLWRWSGPAFVFSTALAVAAIAGFLWSLKFYDSKEFLGLRQLSERNASVDDQERFQLSPLHRWVRHPWYFFALVILWTRDMNAAMLITAIIMTLYFIIGSRLEERKLIRYHGDVYRRYRERVPGLVPLPWKYLRVEEAQALVDDPENGL
jgi:protein-S-isoprenylcysteine O-methyltransferase Ste14